MGMWGNGLAPQFAEREPKGHSYFYVYVVR